jgi:hypothetical protein
MLRAGLLMGTKIILPRKTFTAEISGLASHEFETNTDRSSDSPCSASVYLSLVLGLNMTVSPRLALEWHLTGFNIGAWDKPEVAKLKYEPGCTQEAFSGKMLGCNMRHDFMACSEYHDAFPGVE